MRADSLSQHAPSILLEYVVSLPLAGVKFVADNLSGFLGDFQRGDQALASFGQRAGSTGQQVTNFEHVATGALRRVGEVAVNAGLQAAQAVGTFVADSVNKAGDFDAGMRTFAAAAGDSLAKAGLSVDDFKQQFLTLGAELPVSTSAVQEAATTLIRGGLDPLVIKSGALKDSLQFAAAAGMELGDAAELSIKQLGTFGDANMTAAEQVAFLQQSQDLMVKAAGASTLNVAALGDATLAAGGQAKAAGVDYGDFVTTMGLISPAFGSAAEAGTSYKNFLLRLQPSTKTAAAAMQELGLLTEDGKSKFYDATGAFIGNQAAAELLKTSLTGLSDSQRVQALQTIFGNDAMGAAVALADQGSAGYATFAESMANANGVQQQAAMVQQGFNTALDNMLGSVESLQITLGSALLPILTQLLNEVIAPGINTLSVMTNAIGGSSEAFGQLSPQLQGVVIWLQQLWTQAQSLIAQAQTLTPLLGDNLTPVLAGVALVLGGAVVVAIGSAIVAAVAIVAPILAMIAVGAALYSAWESDFGGVREVVTTVLGAVQRVIQTVLSWAQSFWTKNGDAMMTDTRQTFSTIQTIITTVLQIVQTVVSGTLNAIAGFWRAHGDAISTVARGAWDAIHGIISAVLDTISGITSATLKILKGDWSGAATDIMTTVGTLRTDLGRVFDGMKTALGTLAGDIASAITTGLEGMIARGAKVAQDTADGVKGTFDGLARDAVGLGRNIVDGIIDGVKHGVGALVDAVKLAAASALAAAKKALGIESPSTVFADSVGAMIPAGIQVGIESHTASLERTMVDLGSRLVVSPQQLAATPLSAQRTSPPFVGGRSTTITNQYGGNTTQYTMPIYTNQGPAVLQQSLALVEAMSR